MRQNKTVYRGRFSQIPIYLGKCLRSLVFQDDWKVLPMAAIIAAMVALVACGNMCATMEGTLYGSVALSFVCVWNGLFNSIQSVSREREILKREHRAGLHISSYIAAHMIYQALICLLQAFMMVQICVLAKVPFPYEGLVTPWFTIDAGITFFLITYAADMLGLLVSSLVHSTTAAMTVMPFILIIQLLFSGFMFELAGFAKKLTRFTLSSWGINCLNSLSDYNSKPMVTMWNQLFKLRDVTVLGERPVELITNFMMDNDLRDGFMLESAKYNQNALFIHTAEHVVDCWQVLVVFALLSAAAAILVLERIDKDKRR